METVFNPKRMTRMMPPWLIAEELGPEALAHLGSILNARIGQHLEPVPHTQLPYYHFDEPGSTYL